MEKVRTSIKISGSEWEIMQVIWTLGQTTAQEVTQILADSMDWKPAMIKALLGRLAKKGVVWTEQEGKKFVYHPTILEVETVRSATENFFSYIRTKRIGETVADLVEEATLTQGDINEILKQLEQKQPVETIECNCIPGQCECKQHQQEEEKMKQQFSIEGMSCNHYAARVEEAVNALDGVQKIKVDLKKANGTTKSDETKVQSEKICQAINGLGYKTEVI